MDSWLGTEVAGLIKMMTELSSWMGSLKDVACSLYSDMNLFKIDSVGFNSASSFESYSQIDVISPELCHNSCLEILSSNYLKMEAS